MKFSAIFSQLGQHLSTRQKRASGAAVGSVRESRNFSSAGNERDLQQAEQDRQRWKNIQAEQSKLLQKLSLSNSLLIFIVLIICLILLKLTASFSIPVVLALFLFMVLYPAVEWLYMHWKLPYILSCITVLLLFHFLAFVLLLLISMASFSSLLQALPSYLGKLQVFIQFFLAIAEQHGLDLSQFDSQNLLNKALTSASSILSYMSGGISAFLSSGLSVFLMLLFLLLEGRAFFSTIECSFPAQKSRSIILVYRHSVQQISWYLLIKTLISLVTGAVISTGLWLIGLDFPLVWGILAFVANFIPSVGSIFHTALVSLFSLLQFSDQLHWFAMVLLFLLVTQFVTGNFLEPKLQGNHLRLSPVFILLFLYIWGYIWGITGMLLSVPILSVIKISCQNIPSFRTFAYFLENADFHKLKDAAENPNTERKRDT